MRTRQLSDRCDLTCRLRSVARSIMGFLISEDIWEQKDVLGHLVRRTTELLVQQRLQALNQQLAPVPESQGHKICLQRRIKVIMMRWCSRQVRSCLCPLGSQGDKAWTCISA